MRAQSRSASDGTVYNHKSKSLIDWVLRLEEREEIWFARVLAGGAAAGAAGGTTGAAGAAGAPPPPLPPPAYLFHFQKDSQQHKKSRL